MMLLRAVRSNALRTLRTPAARRGMCTAAAEPLHPLSLKHSSNQVALASTAAVYIGVFRWQYYDRKLAAELAAHKAEAHPEPAEEEAAPEAGAAEVVETPAASLTTAAAPSILPPAPSTSVTSWKTGEVAAWLATIELPMHADAFKAHSIDGTMLLVLTDEDLYKSLGVASPLHRKKIMLAIGELRKGFLGSK
ncbi:hypothetical protein AB1Y20_010277 [Prymnesium parvum]|uniref:SAM domain-containing protein n=1 Tax=Prymnesium parvum TaxID=97485 RepID=A0AB34K8G0_PRYPA